MYEINFEAMIFGFMLGDGWISKSEKMGSKYVNLQCGFSGDEESLKILKDDLINLYSYIGQANIYTRETFSEKYNIAGTTSSMVVTLNICNRYIELGMPIGKRVENEFLLPDWIINGSKEIKASFLSGLYAAEGFTPSMQKNDKTPKTLGFNITKRLYLRDNFDKLTQQLNSILNDLNIEFSIKDTKTFTCDHNIKRSFIFSNSSENILTLAKTLNIRYCIDKQEKLQLLKAYIERKNEVLAVLQKAYIEAMDRSNTARSISEKYNITRSQVEKWRARQTGVRIPNSFPTLTNFKQTYSSL